MAEKKGRGKTACKVEEIIAPAVEQAGYFLWDVDYYKEGADFNLLVTIENPDRTTPINLDDCEKVSRLISPLLDAADPIEESYYLEVSSAGLSRTLSRFQHFAFYVGKTVSVRLYAPLEGKKSLTGTLVSHKEDTLVLEVDGKEVALAMNTVAKVVTCDE